MKNEEYFCSDDTDSTKWVGGTLEYALSSYCHGFSSSSLDKTFL